RGSARRYALQNERRIDTNPQMAAPLRSRHSLLVRITHWVMTLAFLALLVTGLELVVSHPRFYWGEVGNVNTPVMFKIPIPSSRAMVPTGYGYTMPDENGWSRYLHFQSAWVLVFVGLLYVVVGAFNGHFRENVLPAAGDVSPKSLANSVVQHLKFRRPGAEEAWSYNVLQRLAYLAVIFLLFPMIIWTGLAMSPSFVSAFPWAVNLLGGQQSARTLHFFLTWVLVLFLAVHVLMVILAGFWSRVRAMITGRAVEPWERA
ncbi:MAG TPA: cytochrome b/b6 domain-containing protein, partial [Methylomirabilota bacterium]|nr:cytochrome b/b6 domain-containing protein [Methylomirabilota bacterium]